MKYVFIVAVVTLLSNWWVRYEVFSSCAEKGLFIISNTRSVVCTPFEKTGEKK